MNFRLNIGFITFTKNKCVDKKYFTYSIISCIKLLIQLTKIIPMQRYNMYDHAYKISKFGKFDLFARTIIRAVLKFAHLGVREK